MDETKKLLVILSFLVLFINFASASLGITPAGQSINFVPGQKYDFGFIVLTDKPDSKIDLYLSGDFAQYGKLNKDKITGSDGFRVAVELPEGGIAPGQHSIIVRARELPSETDFIGTKIDIGVPIKIFVPYPGRYVELKLNIPNGNINDEIPIELLAINRGRENLDLTEVYVDFFTNDEKVGTLAYTPVSLAVAEERFFRKVLNTSEYKAGDYVAIANVNYGTVASVNQTFRIGSLSVRINNFTDRLPLKGIQKFYIEIESLWNKNIPEIFAEVNLSMGAKNMGFRTPPIDLPAWERKTLEGFFDTSELEDGVYDANVTIYYLGQRTSADGKLHIYKYSNRAIAIAVGVVLALIAGVVAWILIRRKRKKRK